MEQAATHLPADAVRPAVILFTDGKHDVKGVPVSQVQPTRDRLFGNRTPFALLPVGMGLDPKDRGPLEAGLQNMRITRDMPPCVSGATFEWPQVVFDTAEQAGNAVAVALQDASCTFTVAATPPPEPTPVPAAVVVPERRGHARRRPGHRRLDAGPAGRRAPRRSPTTRSAVTRVTPRRSNRPRACRSTGPPS